MPGSMLDALRQVQLEVERVEANLEYASSKMELDLDRRKNSGSSLNNPLKIKKRIQSLNKMLPQMITQFESMQLQKQQFMDSLNSDLLTQNQIISEIASNIGFSNDENMSPNVQKELEILVFQGKRSFTEYVQPGFEQEHSRDNIERVTPVEMYRIRAQVEEEYRQALRNGLVIDLANGFELKMEPQRELIQQKTPSSMMKRTGFKSVSGGIEHTPRDSRKLSVSSARKSSLLQTPNHHHHSKQQQQHQIPSGNEFEPIAKSCYQRLPRNLKTKCSLNQLNEVYEKVYSILMNAPDCYVSDSELRSLLQLNQSSHVDSSDSPNDLQLLQVLRGAGVIRSCHDGWKLITQS